MLLLLHWVFVAVQGLSRVAASGGCLSLECSGFSCFRAQSPSAQSQASWCAAIGCSGCGSCSSWAPERTGLSSGGLWALEHRLRSCGAWAYLLYGMWNLLGLGIKPMSPALAGGFLSTVPLGKPSYISIKIFLINLF